MSFIVVPTENRYSLVLGSAIFYAKGQRANVLDSKGFVGHMGSVPTSQPVIVA